MLIKLSRRKRKRTLVRKPLCSLDEGNPSHSASLGFVLSIHSHRFQNKIDHRNKSLPLSLSRDSSLRNKEIAESAFEGQLCCTSTSLSLCICAGWQVLRRDTSAIPCTCLSRRDSFSARSGIHEPLPPVGSLSWEDLLLLASWLAAQKLRAHVCARNSLWNRCCAPSIGGVHGVSRKRFHDLNHWSV